MVHQTVTQYSNIYAYKRSDTTNDLRSLKTLLKIIPGVCIITFHDNAFFKKKKKLYIFQPFLFLFLDGIFSTYVLLLCYRLQPIPTENPMDGQEEMRSVCEISDKRTVIQVSTAKIGGSKRNSRHR